VSEPEQLALPVDLFAHGQLFGCRFEPGKPEAFALPLPAALHKAVAKRQCEFLAGRWCIARLYDRLGLALPLPDYIEQASPDWPEAAGWHGSISHTRDVAAAVLAPRSQVRAIGLDLEYLIASDTAARVRNSILSPAELARMQAGAGGSDWIVNLTLAFSFKESLFKAWHPQIGAYFGFEAAEILAVDGDWIHFEPKAELAQAMASQDPRRGRWRRQGELILTAYESA
jgi:enterobactin synthetase component D